MRRMRAASDIQRKLGVLDDQEERGCVVEGRQNQMRLTYRRCGFSQRTERFRGGGASREALGGEQFLVSSLVVGWRYGVPVWIAVWVLAGVCSALVCSPGM